MRKKPAELYNAYKGSDLFRRIASRTAHGVGHPLTFVGAIVAVLVWAASGKLFGFSDTWQLVINTSTTIITFLMVFLIQASQNRDAKAIHLKLDELVRASQARNAFADLEEADEEELDALEQEFRELRRRQKSGRAARTAGAGSRTSVRKAAG